MISKLVIQEKMKMTIISSKNARHGLPSHGGASHASFPTSHKICNQLRLNQLSLDQLRIAQLGGILVPH